MGIPGLKTRVEAECTTEHDLVYLRNGAFYIDGLNLLERICHSLEKHNNKPLYADFVKAIVPIIYKFVCLDPEKLTFYFDVARYSTESIEQKLNTAVDPVPVHHLTMAHDLFTYLIRRYCLQVNVVYTAMNAEDHIANDIFAILQDESAEKRLHVIFSDDSDCYTFKLPKSNLVEIVPLNDVRRDWPWTTINTVNLRAAHAMVPTEHRKDVPLPRRTIRLGELKRVSSWTNSRLSRVLIEFMHTIGYYNTPTIHLPVIFHVYNVPEPYDIAQGLRLTLYGLILHQLGVEQFFLREVAEVHQSGRRLAMTTLKVPKDDALKRELEYLSSTPVQEIITDQFEHVASKYNLKPHHITAVGEYVGALMAQPDNGSFEALPSDEDMRSVAFKLHCLLKAVLVSLQLFYGTTECFYDDSVYLLLWKISPLELSCYVRSNE